MPGMASRPLAERFGKEKAQAIEKDYQALMTASKPEDRKSLATKIMNAL